MAGRAQCRTKRRRHAVITGLLALLLAVLAGAGPAAAATLPVSSSGATQVAFSPDGSLLAAGYADGTVRLWSVASGQAYGPVLRRGAGAAGGATGMAFSPDGSLLAA